MIIGLRRGAGAFAAGGVREFPAWRFWPPSPRPVTMPATRSARPVDGDW